MALLREIGVGIGQIIVAIIDDGIVITRIIIGVVIANLEIGNGLEIVISSLINSREVTAELAKEIGADGNLLQLIENTHIGVNGVVCRIERILIGIEDIVVAHVQHVITRSQQDTASHKKPKRAEGEKIFHVFHNYFV